MAKVYECHNEHCSLGTPVQPGRFTGGRTKDAVTLLTGNPEPDEDTYGKGVCPNCGSAGEETE